MGVFQGCTIGFWCQQPQTWGPTNYNTTDIFDTVFGVALFGANVTLLEAVCLDIGEPPVTLVEQLAAQATAALLNAAHPNISYPLTEAQVIALFQQALASGDPQEIEDTKDLFEAYNESICPITPND
jgi:hypothetical protein